MIGDEASSDRYYDELADAYELFFRDLPANMEEEGTWLDGILRGHRVRTVLDASCGTGRHAIPLRERGYDVVAADPSREMLRQADREARCRHADLPLFQARFTDLPYLLGGPFDAVVALGNGLCNQDNLAAIQKSLLSLRQCCRNGGVCLVGIKDFAAIRADFIPFHGHRVIDGADRTILFEVWKVEEPVLVCTAYLLRGPGPTSTGNEQWMVRTASTREYMLPPEQFERTALDAGFRSVRRIERAVEATFLLTG